MLLTPAHRIESELGAALAPLGLTVSRLGLLGTVAAGGLPALHIYPRQRDALADPDDGKRLRTLSMLAGIYNLLWAIVVVLIVRPGSRP
ncbi:hypothetical protein [Streptosporangium minutum]|uniref:hypothetical protein n=1 Tax=Streptosporangium minutum TaxID=569862 RepID=UPI0026D5CF32